MFFIGPPFGNYISLPNTISISGSFTLNERPGLYSQIIKTLYYSYTHNGWVNKIGLRNKGIDWALKNVNEKNILSVAILNENEIPKLLEKIPENRNIELNISCPNAEHDMVSNGISKFINPSREWCILKLSPIMDNKEIHKYYDQGFRQFHCSNTIPVKNGGLSGDSIKPYTNDKIEYITNNFDDAIVIAGGGVRNIYDAQNYLLKGANHFSASTIFFNPYLSCKLYFQYINMKK